MHVGSLYAGKIDIAHNSPSPSAPSDMQAAGKGEDLNCMSQDSAYSTSLCPWDLLKHQATYDCPGLDTERFALGTLQLKHI